MERFKKFQRVVIGIQKKVTIVDIDIPARNATPARNAVSTAGWHNVAGGRNYAKYVLREGKDVEKRELLGCLRGKIELKNKIITLL